MRWTAKPKREVYELMFCPINSIHGRLNDLVADCAWRRQKRFAQGLWRWRRQLGIGAFDFGLESALVNADQPVGSARVKRTIETVHLTFLP